MLASRRRGAISGDLRLPRRMAGTKLVPILELEADKNVSSRAMRSDAAFYLLEDIRSIGSLTSVADTTCA